RRDVVVAQVVDARHPEARLLERRLLAQSKPEEQVEPAGAEQQDVAGPQLDALRGPARLEVVGRDVGARLEPVDALVPGEIEEYGPAREPARLLDTALRRARV